MGVGELGVGGWGPADSASRVHHPTFQVYQSDGAIGDIHPCSRQGELRPCLCELPWEFVPCSRSSCSAVGVLVNEPRSTLLGSSSWASRG